MILTDDQNKRHVSFMFVCSVTTLITRQMSVVFFFLYNFAYIVTSFILNRKLTTFASEIKCHMSISCNTFSFNRWNSLTLYIIYILAKKCADGRILSYLASLNCVLLTYDILVRRMICMFRGQNYKERVRNDKF